MKMIRCIPFLKCNRQVDYIDRSYCSLNTVPEDIIRFYKTLEELYLNSNHIKELPRAFFRLTKLRKLSLHDNEIEVIPSEIGNFIHLVEFDASKNDFDEIPESIKNCTQLQIIDFSSTYISYLSSGITRLQNLTTLYLNFTAMQNLPDDFGSLINLENLELRENELRVLPHSFKDLKRLIRLDLAGNLFRVLPPLIGELLNLEELWLDKNDLRSLPGEIGNLTKLQSFDITDNKLEGLPNEIVSMKSLVDLHLSKNCIEQLPDGIGELTKLTILKLDENKLTDLNPTIGGCKQLQELMLTENFLTRLPVTIGNLTNLTILNLNSNKLEELPSTICNLTKLGIISLRNNDLTYLPNEMGQLKKLHVLDVANNQLQYLPYSITQLNLEALWLSENQSHPLLKFQTDFDPITNNKVLTCFLLPQQKESPDSQSIENLLDSTLQRINSINWEKPKSSTVKFFENEGVDEEDDENDVQFVRHNTPHPKELKARHQKLFNKENEQHQDHENQQQETNDDAMQLSNKSESEASESSVIVRQGYENSNLISNKTSTIPNLNEIDSSPAVNQDMLDNYLDIQSPNNHLDQQYQDEYYLNEQQQQYQNEANQDEDYQTDKHVLFPDQNDYDLNNEHKFEPHNKLHRRDTPHHLKNKRINSMTNKADADKVASILDKLNNQMNYDEGGLKASGNNHLSASNSSFRPSVNNFNNVNNLEYLDDQQRLPGNYLNEPIEQTETITYHLSRSREYGLGLSIAGGRGTTPYRDNDDSIFVSNVVERSPAHVAGLQIGDKVLGVNTISLIDADHYTAVRVFKQAGEQFSLHISRTLPNHNSISNPISNANQVYPTSSASNLNASNQLASSYSNGGIRNLAFDERLMMNNSFPSQPENNLNNSNLANNELANGPRIQYATLIRDSKGIGITVANDSLSNIFIESVTRQSYLDDGKVREKDRLVSINGKDIKKLNMTIEQVNAILDSEDTRFIRIVTERI